MQADHLHSSPAVAVLAIFGIPALLIAASSPLLAVIDKISCASHSVQPLLDVAGLKPGSLGNMYRRHWAFAGHRAKQAALTPT
jgi:hypothetical protein